MDNNQELHTDVKHQMYVIRAVQEKPDIWRIRRGVGRRNLNNKMKIFNQIGRRMSLEFNDCRFLRG